MTDRPTAPICRSSYAATSRLSSFKRTRRPTTQKADVRGYIGDPRAGKGWECLGSVKAPQMLELAIKQGRRRVLRISLKW
jgi:hypothetical protein